MTDLDSIAMFFAVAVVLLVCVSVYEMLRSLLTDRDTTAEPDDYATPHMPDMDELNQTADGRRNLYPFSTTPDEETR